MTAVDGKREAYIEDKYENYGGKKGRKKRERGGGGGGGDEKKKKMGKLNGEGRCNLG